MADTFTGQLGTIDSTPGNLVLGIYFLAGAGSLTQSQSQALNLQQAAVSQTIFTRDATQSLSFAHSIRPFAKFNRTTTQSLSLVSEADGHRAFSEVITDALTFTQQLTNVHVIKADASNHLTLTGVATRTNVYHRAAADTLTFNTYNSKPLFLNGTVLLQLPALATVKPRRCIVIFESPGLAVVLPCPLFDDTEGNENTLLIKRSMTNVLRTYIRQNSLQKLNYRFHIHRLKSLELKQFVTTNFGNIVKMTNWKGEEWRVNFTNSPVDLIPKARYEPTREMVEITLEMQGVRVAG